MRNRKPLLLIPIAAMALLLCWPAASQEELDPLKVASDTHRLLFENALVRVISARVPSGKVEPKHKHPHGVTVYLADYDIEQKTFPKGTMNKSHRSFGTVTWGGAIVHEIRNIGKTESHSIRIELK
jgi:hypothetical protein